MPNEKKTSDDKTGNDEFQILFGFNTRHEDHVKNNVFEPVLIALVKEIRGGTEHRRSGERKRKRKYCWRENVSQGTFFAGTGKPNQDEEDHVQSLNAHRPQERPHFKGTMNEEPHITDEEPIQHIGTYLSGSLNILHSILTHNSAVYRKMEKNQPKEKEWRLAYP